MSARRVLLKDGLPGGQLLTPTVPHGVEADESPVLVEYDEAGTEGGEVGEGGLALQDGGRHAGPQQSGPRLAHHTRPPCRDRVNSQERSSTYTSYRSVFAEKFDRATLCRDGALNTQILSADLSLRTLHSWALTPTCCTVYLYSVLQTCVMYQNILNIHITNNEILHTSTEQFICQEGCMIDYIILRHLNIYCT